MSKNQECKNFCEWNEVNCTGSQSIYMYHPYTCYN